MDDVIEWTRADLKELVTQVLLMEGIKIHITDEYAHDDDRKDKEPEAIKIRDEVKKSLPVEDQADRADKEWETGDDGNDREIETQSQKKSLKSGGEIFFEQHEIRELKNKEKTKAHHHQKNE